MSSGLDRRLEHIEKDTRVRSTDLAQLLRDALEVCGRDDVVALCESYGVTLETVKRWAAEPWRHEPGTVRRHSP